MRYRTPAALEMAVKEAARQSEMDTGRAIESFYYHRFLCRVFSVPASKFVLKGGRSVLARTTRARYSRDADFVVSEMELEQAIEELKHLASIEMDDFISFELSETKPIRQEDDYRDGARLVFSARMGAKELQPLIIDLVSDRIPYEEVEWIAPVDRVDVKHLDVFDYCVVPVAFALADKFCAILETHAGRPSSRVKDLVDILVYLETEDIDTKAFAAKLESEAAMRRIGLPEYFAVPQMWFERYLGVYAKMIREVALEAKYPSLAEASEAAAQLFRLARSN